MQCKVMRKRTKRFLSQSSSGLKDGKAHLSYGIEIFDARKSERGILQGRCHNDLRSKIRKMSMIRLMTTNEEQIEVPL